MRGTTSTASRWAAAAALAALLATAGFDLTKAGAAYATGAAAVRAEAGRLGGAARTAGEQVATEMEAAGRTASTTSTDDPTAYVAAQKKVGDALVSLARACEVSG